MDPKEMAAEIDDKIDSLDLHGLYTSTALDALENFLYNISRRNVQHAKVIYGIGKGVLENEVVKYLTGHPLIEKIIKKSGHCLIILK
jgi:DNA-nicking Smr family endonuclease